MPQSFEVNQQMREQGWRVFRSASRDHLTPATGVGQQLQRITIREALPVREAAGGLSVSLEARLAERAGEQSALTEQQALLRRATEERGISWQRVGWGQDTSGLAGNVTRTVIGTVSFDSLVSDVTFIVQGGGGSVGSARVEFENYGTLFAGGGVNGLGYPTDTISPQPIANLSGDGVTVSIPGLRWFVGGGSRIFLDVVNGGGGFVITGQVIITAEALSPSQRQVVTRPDVVPLGEIISLRRADAQRQLDRQQELIEAAKQRKRDELAFQEQRIAAIKEVGARQFERAVGRVSPLGLPPQVVLQMRPPSPPSPPRMRPPPPEPPEGAGKTFVSAWNPSFGSIGYLVPDPPRGGKVNVFDNTYTIWDMSGKNVGSGPIIPVASDGDIPPGARISPIRGGVPPRGLTPATGPGSTEF